MTPKIDNRKITQPGLFDDNANISEEINSVYAVMYCDGASSGNPGKSGIGVVINPSDENFKTSDKDENTLRISEYIGIATNNVAEYSALIKGLEIAKSHGIKKIKIFLDSELLVRQLNGIYRVKNKHLLPLFNKVNNLLQHYQIFSIIHVRREFNKEADSLARKAVSMSK